MTASVFVFNPFAEGYIAHGKAFTPVKHQAMLAEDLANLPQFLCKQDDIVLLTKRPSAAFLTALNQVGFPPPEFVELSDGHINPADNLCRRKFSSLRPWAWGPDSVELFEPLFPRVASEARSPGQYFNDDIAQLYSKAWSTALLRKVLAHCRQEHEAWLCSDEEAGVAVDTIEGTLGAIAAIRSRGHHRVIVKEAYGVAGHNAIRLWEPEISPAQRQWLVHSLGHGRQLVVEPCLERELDFSVQLEMGSLGLKLCGYTGLINDRKGQFLANWCEAGYGQCLPGEVARLLRAQSEPLHRIYDKILYLIEAELRRVAFAGPVSLDAFVYRTPQSNCRLKPIVEINPRYTMGRVTVELMKHTWPGSCGLFRIINRAQARAEGFIDLSGYARSLGERVSLRLEGETLPKIRQGAFCLNDPALAKVCLATFEVSPTLPPLVAKKGKPTS